MQLPSMCGLKWDFARIDTFFLDGGRIADDENDDDDDGSRLLSRVLCPFAVRIDSTSKEAAEAACETR